jgi:hypothetical protein
MKKLKQEIDSNKKREHCTKPDDCWNYDYMIKYKFTLEDMYAVCRKCIFNKLNDEEKPK